MYEYFLIFMILGGVGLLIGFLVSLLGKQINLLWSIAIFYVIAAVLFQLEPVILKRLTLSEAMTLDSFASSFMYYLFVNTFIGLPIFLLSRKLFLKINFVERKK